MKAWDREIEREILADGCRRSLWLFAKYAYGVALNPKGKWFNPVIHRAKMEWLQGHLYEWMEQRKLPEGERMKIMCTEPRAGGKTMSNTKIAQLWIHLHIPDASTYTDSESMDKAQKFMSSNLAVLEGLDPFSLFPWLYGIWYRKDRKWTTRAAVHGYRQTMSISEPSFGAISVESGLTGDHPDAIFFDDPITREKLREEQNWLKVVSTHMVAQIPALATSGLFLYSGTRYAEGDAQGETVEKEGIKSLAGMMPDDPLWEPTPGGAWHVWYWEAEDAEGNSTIPSCWSTNFLRAYRQRDPEDYMAQMMNRPATGEHMPVHRSDMEKLWINKRDIPEDGYIWIHMDTAFRFAKRKARGDYNVIVFNVHHRDGSGKVDFLESRYSKDWGPKEFFRALIGGINYYRKQGYWIRGMTDEIEAGGKGEAWLNLLQSWFNRADIQMPRMVLIHRQTQKLSKDDRLVDACSFITNGFVRFVRHAHGVHILENQILKVTKTKHDDHFEAFADSFNEDVYRPARRGKGDSDEEITPLRPQDNILMMNEQQIPHEDVLDDLKRQDEQHQMAYAPIGADDDNPFTTDIVVDPWEEYE